MATKIKIGTKVFFNFLINGSAKKIKKRRKRKEERKKKGKEVGGGGENSNHFSLTECIIKIPSY